MEFTAGRGGVWAVFDVDEGAAVSLVRAAPGGLELVREGRSAADKSDLAVGDGSYLAVLTNTSCDIGQVGYEMALLVERVGQTVQATPRVTMGS